MNKTPDFYDELVALSKEFAIEHKQLPTDLDLSLDDYPRLAACLRRFEKRLRPKLFTEGFRKHLPKFENCQVHYDKEKTHFWVRG